MVARADRAAFLIDGQAYFSALLRTLQRARRCVWILGWDIDSRICLRPDRKGPDLRTFLNNLVQRRPELVVRVLNWDFAMVYALERQPLPVFHMDWTTHERLVFELDSAHPFGASHHQKIVAADDSVGFCGGLDLTKRRWDTREHVTHDTRRHDPASEYYGPFHDVQLMVDGEAAAALGDIARERWRAATGEDVPPVASKRTLWPAKVKPAVQDVDVAVARTCPAYDGREQVREIEQLYLDAIRAADKLIYIENQYFTASVIADALAVRLAEDDGPEVIVVLPLESTGWLEQAVMDIRRSPLLRQLDQADKHGRLRLYFPVGEGGEEKVKVHSKIMTVDDVFCRVGSANLSNRSMGLDTECDLAFVASTEEQAQAVTQFRRSLTAEHLGVSIAALEAVELEQGGVAPAMDSLLGPGRSLRKLPLEAPESVKAVPEELVRPLDPERPVSLADLVELFDPERSQDTAAPSRRFGVKQLSVGFAAVGGFLAVAAMFALAWKYTQLQHYTQLEQAVEWGRALQHWQYAWLAVIGVYVVLGQMAFPVTVLIAATALIFPSWEAVLYAFAGSQLSALAGYMLGWAMGRGALRRLVKGRLNVVSRKLVAPGVGVVAAVRLAPLAPFTVVNMICGAMRIRLKDYMLGTLAGMAPGVIGVSLFTDQLLDALLHPDWRSLLVLAILAAAVLLLSALLRRWRGAKK